MNARQRLVFPGPNPLSRRGFLRRAFAHSAVLVVPAGVLGRAGETVPSQRLNLACIGAGGRGRADLEGVSSENIVALCDVDETRGADAMKAFPKARFFTDYRRMYDRMGRELDGVVVATPDHTHAAAVMGALGLGKHVYCEKPLAHSLHEVRTLTQAARRTKVTTQVGNQGHSSESIRQFVELVRAGAIGAVREIHLWNENSYRPAAHRVRPATGQTPPPHLHWDLWLGPASERAYHPVYHPGRWRGWVAFGTGIIGDWTCHQLDPSYWALDLGSPTSVRAESEEYDAPEVRAETFPAVSTVTYEFPARGTRPGVTVKWFTGRLAPRPEELEPQRQMPKIGALVVGDRGQIMHGSHGAGGAQIIPVEKDRAYQRPPQTIPRVKDHYEDWMRACKDGRPAGSGFEYGGPLTEVALLGVLAQRFTGQRLEWDSAELKITNHGEANQCVNPPCRPGWELPS